MNRFELWLNRVYRPNPKPWKRRALFWLSIAILILIAIGGYTQHRFDYAGNEIWWLYGFFGALGLAGFLVSLFGNEFWVAMFLGRL